MKAHLSKSQDYSAYTEYFFGGGELTFIDESFDRTDNPENRQGVSTCQQLLAVSAHAVRMSMMYAKRVRRAVCINSSKYMQRLAALVGMCGICEK